MKETDVNAHHNIKHILILHQSGSLDTISTISHPNLMGFPSSENYFAQ